ncbi:unnamed protein product [Cuscuta europaea]|uniref:Uncharacterized protein n=1 Tax=Cuscuta europaea TaxID=41803 RepID=A0A9P1E2X7_CUSEU|nr:unnamed protein product [Cuscuta europaea]
MTLGQATRHLHSSMPPLGFPTCLKNHHGEKDMAPSNLATNQRDENNHGRDDIPLYMMVLGQFSGDLVFFSLQPAYVNFDSTLSPESYISFSILCFLSFFLFPGLPSCVRAPCPRRLGGWVPPGRMASSPPWKQATRRQSDRVAGRPGGQAARRSCGQAEVSIPWGSALSGGRPGALLPLGGRVVAAIICLAVTETTQA